MKSFLSQLFDRSRRPAKRHKPRRTNRRLSGRIESLEARNMMSADPLPVLMVLADQQDFYYREYGDTRASLEAAGLDVAVAATTTNPTTPHAGTGQGASSGVVVPDLALAEVDVGNYSAIAFVGGWGASMYQYAYSDPNFDGIIDNYYEDALYNGDPAAKQIVNNLINEFLADNKRVAAICHAVTVLAWARDASGVSPLAGKQVVVPTTVHSPNQFYNGQQYDWLNYDLGQYEQVIANGALASPNSGHYGDPDTAADDVRVDGQIITGENFNSALYFGAVIAQEILSSNAAPLVFDAAWELDENTPTGTMVGAVAAFDPDADQSLNWSITGGNTNNAFAIDPATGAVTVADAAALDFETTSNFVLTVQAIDNGVGAMGDFAEISINLLDLDETPPGPMSVGVNLESNLDWSPAWIFKDAFLRSRPWGVQAHNPQTLETTWQVNVGDGPALAVDENGWVTELQTWVAADGTEYEQRATTVVFTPQAHMPEGIYRVEWDGTGVLDMWYVNHTGTTPDGRHFALLQVPPDAHLSLTILSTDPADPIRNINVWMPDYNGQSMVLADAEWNPGNGESPFHPLFVERLQAFDTLRFMDWMTTNFTNVVTWDDRRMLDDATQSDGDLLDYFHTSGIALEYMIALANEVDANPWFNMPYQADDNFVSQFASMVRDQLDPDLTAYVEYSNEVWNWQFPTAGWLDAQGQSSGLNYLQAAGQEMQRDFDIWSQVFVGQEDRFVRIVAGQQANPDVLNQLLASVAGRVDAVSVSAYAGISFDQSGDFPLGTTADDIIDTLYAESIPWALDRLAEHRDLADQYEALLGREMPLLTYESGSHVVGNPSQFPLDTNLARAAAAEAMRSPRMYDVYQTLLTGARAAGVELYNEFIFTGDSEPNYFGNYGLLFNMQESLDDAHQLRSILDFINAQQEVPASAPVVADGTWWLDENTPSGSIVGSVTAMDADSGQTLTYAIVGGNTDGAFAIDPVTGVVSVANAAALNFEATPSFTLTILATDNGIPALEGLGQITINLDDVNETPVVADDIWSLVENTPLGTLVGIVTATDADAGQTLSYAIVGGNTNGAFAIDPATGVVTIANAAAINFEAIPTFILTIQATDNGAASLAGFAQITINLQNVVESPVSVVGKDVLVMGTADSDTIYLWSDVAANVLYAWINGEMFGPLRLPAGGRVVVHGGDGNDQIFSTDLRIGAIIYGDGGHDLLTGGTANDLLDGGDGCDRVWGGPGDDLILGGAGNDFLYGREGNDIILGGAGDDWLAGCDGRDLLIGGLGSDHLCDDGGNDLVVGGNIYDNHYAAVDALMAEWLLADDLGARIGR